MTQFNLGQLVQSRSCSQGLVANETYEVVGIDERPTPFGNFVTYILVKPDERSTHIPVANGHLLLDPVPTPVGKATKGNCSPCDDGWIAYASDIGFDPGQWPREIETNLGNRRPFRASSVEEDETHIYVQGTSGLRLVILND